MEPAIKIEKLSKKYILQHQAKESYVALRDVMTNNVKKVFSGEKSTRPTTEEFWALKDVSFEVNAGERLGIIGRNGAGKSTMLKILSRITDPTEGRVTINGRVSSLLEVGTGFHPELTGRENIFLNGSILGMGKREIQAKFDEIVAFAEIEKFLDTPVKRYSSGMYVRLAFAVAAHLEPDILIIDEVLAVGDAAFQKKCLGKMEDVSKHGRTVLFVSHNMATVTALCNRVAIMEKGRLKEIGDTEAIINSYLHAGKKNTGGYRDDSPASANAKLKIRSIRILNNNSLSVSELNNENKGFVEIEFEVLQEGRGYDATIQLNHFQYGVIFTSCIKDVDPVESNTKVWQKGTYKYLIELPMNILRGGDYSVTAASAIPKVEVLDVFEYETTFSVFDSISPVAKTTEGRNGAILPVIEWRKV
ncbi:MAG TPA: polysaccharide ABC transporter ATP-binding protein [Bacteroidia bacterium]|jgi:lipopolysaccharide transport system ATP-binding protein|nr:polysaccharide ABC transporter ATP-binding protein [Bacteroidia bacterium]